MGARPHELKPGELAGRARELVPLLRERAAATREARRIPEDVLDALGEAGVLAALQPACFGGLQADYLEFSDALHELAQGCGSGAWVAGVLGEHAWVVAMFPERAQREVWRDGPESYACASFAPVGTAARVAGGWKINGRWPFASGCSHAQWAILGASTGLAGPEAVMNMLVPMAALEVIDDWQVIGLEGTGSKSLVAREVFVPDWCAASHEAMKRGRAPGREVHPDWWLARAPRNLMAPFTLIAVVTGLARRAVDLFADRTAGRSSRGINLGDSELMQLKVAEACAEADAARTVLRTHCIECTDVVRSGVEVPMEMLVRGRRDTAYAAKLARQAADRVFAGSGASGVYEATALQPVYRDMLAACSHLFMGWEAGGLPYGQWRLGRPVTSPQI